MLLIFKSASKNPKMTDTLVEYLFNYVHMYDAERATQSLQSVGRVFADCESKGVVPSIVSGLINHPKLNPETHQRLKTLYRGGIVAGGTNIGNSLINAGGSSVSTEAAGLSG